MTVSDQRWRLVAYLVMAMALPFLFVSSCRHIGESSNPKAEVRFRELLGSALTDKLVIHTDKHRYQHDDGIVYRVENRTDVDLWFEDQSFGVQAFAYDEASEDWVELDLGFYVSDPRTVLIECGREAALDFYGLWVERIDLPEDGKIRLVITGHTNLTVPALDETYVAYTDIEVVE
jgi:hypothetical protein